MEPHAIARLFLKPPTELISSQFDDAGGTRRAKFDAR
jgi:hypothetical protein